MSKEHEVIKPKPNTIEAVANLAGVSTMTVSRVLRDTGNVSAKTQERVREAISSLGYVHNRLAGALASSRSTQIAILVPSIQNIVFADVLAGVAERFDGTGFQPVIGVTEYDGERELELVRSMMAWRCAGIVLGHPSHLPATTHLLQNADFPVVELMALQEQPIDMCVGLDQCAAGREMALHLLKKGYRRYAYLGTPHEIDTSASLRYQAFCKTLNEHGASFGGMELASALPIPITTTLSPRYTIGQLGADQIIRRIAGETIEAIHDVGFELIPGASS